MLAIGDRVRKIRGKGIGESGQVTEIDAVGKIKVTLDSGSVTNSQSATNFEPEAAVVAGADAAGDGNKRGGGGAGILGNAAKGNAAGGKVRPGPADDGKEGGDGEHKGRPPKKGGKGGGAAGGCGGGGGVGGGGGGMGRDHGAPPPGGWYDDPVAHPFPPEFTAKSVRGQPIHDPNGTVHWDGRDYSAGEWATLLRRWTRDYPSLTTGKGNKKCTPAETIGFRTRATSLKEHIDHCWDSMPQNHTQIRSKYRDRFRCDAFGNVVSRQASDSALCKFDVDHVWPWSRGGRSVRGNFWALQVRLATTCDFRELRPRDPVYSL